MKIQLKRSNVLSGGAAKEPTAQQMEYGELAVNYNEADPTIFIKDSGNNIIRLTGEGAVGAPTVGEGTITITANGETVGTFNVNQEGDTEIVFPDSATVNPPSPDEPTGENENGDLWVDTSECPPVLKVWSDCEGTGQWYELSASAPKPIEPNPGDGNNSITPTPPGSGTELDPYVLTAKTINYGQTVQTDEVISFSNQKPGALVQFVDQNTSDNGNRFSQPAGVIGADGSWSGRLNFADTPATSVDTTYTGLLKIGSSSIYYSWNVTSETAVIPPPVITQNPVISSDSNETDDPITVDTRAAVTNATFTSSAWLKDGSIIPGATSTTSYTPADPGSYKFREVFTGNDGSTVNADSNELLITVDLTKPNATMHGLRFDSARSTKLSRAGSGTGTISYWKKDASTNWVWQHEHQTGAAYPAEIGASYDGYMSDYYFIDGQDLPPETFGKYFDGNSKWGPLDSSEVKANITSNSAFPDDQYDTSQVWSDQSNDVVDVNYLFDGNLNSYTATTSSQKSWTMNFSPALSGPIRLHVGSWNESLNWSTNEGSGTVGISSAGWYNITTATAVTELTITRAGAGATVSAIEVDGKILVDAPSFGANGFFLPFDPAATSENYTSGIISTLVNPTRVYGTFTGGGFNGQPGNFVGSGDGQGNFCGSQTTGTQTGNLVIPINKSYSSSIAMYGWVNTGGNITLTIDGVTYPANLPPNETGKNVLLTTIAGIPSSGTLESITISQSAAPGSTGFTGIYLDGVLLVNRNNIGADDSGNDNHFADENFAVGNTSQVWSAGGSQTNADSARPITNLFDGSTQTLVASASNTNESIISFAEVTANTSVEIYTNVGSSASAPWEIRKDGATRGTWAKSGSSNDNGWHTFTGVTYPVSFNQLKIQRTAANEGSGCSALRVDGKILVDGNTQDTVTDTPVRNYAVLESGSNGNLVGSGALTYTGEVGKTYYYETDGVGVTAAAPVPDVGTGKHNFGQQPFGGSRVISYDQAAGTVEIAGKVAGPGEDTSQNWSSGTGVNNRPQSPITNLFDGDENTEWGIDDNTNASFTFETPIPVTSSVRLFVSHLGSGTAALRAVTIDGTDYGEVLTSATSPYWMDIDISSATLPSTITAIKVGPGTSGGSGGTSLMEVDSKILVDNGGGTYDTLYQTWSQWVRTALGYALDRIAALEQQRTSDLATITELRTNITAALARITSIESNEVADDAVDTVLLNTVADLITRVEALEAN